MKKIRCIATEDLVREEWMHEIVCIKKGEKFNATLYDDGRIVVEGHGFKDGLEFLTGSQVHIIKCNKCDDSGYFEYETGVVHEGYKDKIKEPCDCTALRIEALKAVTLLKQMTEPFSSKTYFNDEESRILAEKNISIIEDYLELTRKGKDLSIVNQLRTIPILCPNCKNVNAYNIRAKSLFDITDITWINCLICQKHSPIREWKELKNNRT
jgi:hypothetical protein